MKTAKRLFRILIFLVIGFLVWESAYNEAWAQRGGGRGGRGGRGRGGMDMNPSQRRGPFSNLPLGAQELLGQHQEAYRSLPPQLRAYILTALRGWDSFFPPEKKQFEVFFRKAKNAAPEELRDAFQGTLPPLPRRNVQDSPPPDESDVQPAPRRGRRGRWGAAGGGGRTAPGRRGPRISFTPAQFAKIDAAFDRYVFADMGIGPGLIVIAFSTTATPAANPVLQDSLISQGTLLKNVAFTHPPKTWIAALLTGCEDPIKGKNLRYPSLFEYHNRDMDDKTHTRTLALYPDKDAPPAVSKTRGFGKKYGPLAVRASDFEPAVSVINSELETARQKGRSERYIERMVKPKFTSKMLKLNKTLNDEALMRLVTRTLLASDENLKLDNTFLRNLAFGCLLKAQPDLFLVHLKDDGSPENQHFVQTAREVHQSHYRYKDRTTLAVLDQRRGQVLIIGPDIPAGREISEPHTLQDLSVTLSRRANIRAAKAQGAPLQDLVAR